MELPAQAACRDRHLQLYIGNWSLIGNIEPSLSYLVATGIHSNMKRKLWLVITGMGILFGVIFASYFLVTMRIHLSDWVEVPVIIAIPSFFSAFTLYLIRTNRIMLNWLRSFLYSFTVLFSGSVFFFLFFRIRNMLLTGEYYFSLRDLRGLYILIGCAAVISAIVALFFRKRKGPSETSNTLDDPHF